MSVIFTRTRRTLVGAVLFIMTIASLSPGRAIAGDRIFDLYIKNIDSQPVTMTLSQDLNNCYEGDMPLGTIETIGAGSQVKIRIARVQGHGCNGHQGEFAIVFSPGAGPNNTVQRFNFDNEGDLELTEGYPNPYRGHLSGKDSQNGSYTYTTWVPAHVTAGKAVGRWIQLCQQLCDVTVSNSITSSNSTQSTQSKETTNAISATLESGIKFEGVGGITGSITSGEEKRVGRSMSMTFANGVSDTDTRHYAFTQEQMTNLNIFALWQWVATTDLSDGSQITLKTIKITCTPGDDPPDYLPGSGRDLKACRGSK